MIRLLKFAPSAAGNQTDPDSNFTSPTITPLPMPPRKPLKGKTKNVKDKEAGGGRITPHYDHTCHIPLTELPFSDDEVYKLLDMDLAQNSSRASTRSPSPIPGFNIEGIFTDPKIPSFGDPSHKRKLTEAMGTGSDLESPETVEKSARTGVVNGDEHLQFVRAVSALKFLVVASAFSKKGKEEARKCGQEIDSTLQLLEETLPMIIETDARKLEGEIQNVRQKLEIDPDHKLYQMLGGLQEKVKEGEREDERLRQQISRIREQRKITHAYLDMARVYTGRELFKDDPKLQLAGIFESGVPENVDRIVGEFIDKQSPPIPIMQVPDFGSHQSK